ncbi:helix-turn-helix domain-containing protein [Streptomyces mirabilis]|uniref:helix-turn-helix domain-containing protein n=1 Tax=Streptomyces sp. NPDC005388 TaxID=3156717 RepID=UPI0033A371F0
MTQHDGSSARPTPGRLEFERAIRRSDLPPPSRHLALTIATWADMDTGLIPERFQPSLSTLEEATGLTRKTVRTHLDTLEARGWIVRDRPELKKAQVEHARTHYFLALAVEARGSDPLGLGEEIPQPRGSDTPAKGRRSPRARGGDPPKSPYESQNSSSARDSATANNSQQQRKSKPAATGPIPGDAPHLEDVEAICNHLADAIQKATGERPKITKREWRDPARLMLDADGRALEQVLTAIDWAHADEFWRGVVANPKVLRKNYMTLRQKAAAEQRKAPYQNPDDQDVYDEDLI